MTAIEAECTPQQGVRVLQRKLYRAAKAQPGRTFGVLYDKVCSRDVLREAWTQVRRNRGAAGVDGETITAIESRGVEAFLEELREELCSQSYRPGPVRRVFIPKADGKQRPLGIPRIKDRVAQAAVKIVIEPLFEASFRPGSFGFRPKRSASQAVDEIWRWVNRDRDAVIDLDLKSYFDTIDHDLLMSLVRRRVRDPRVLRLIRRWLRAGVMLEGRREESALGTPQGGVISPLLANIYLHPLDVYWEREMGATKMVRYADDLVVLCRKGRAEKAMPVLRRFLGRLKLTVNEEKTRITTAQEGFDFLGVHFRRKASRKQPGCSFCYNWPSLRSVKRISEKVRAATRRNETCPSLTDKIRQLAPAIRGWGNYFVRTNASVQFSKVDRLVWWRLWRWYTRKHAGKWKGSPASFSALLERAGLPRLAGRVCWMS